MAKESEAKDVLVPFLEASQSVSPTVQTVSIGGNVCHVDCSSINRLKGLKFCLKPLYLVSRVIPVLDKPPVHVVA